MLMFALAGCVTPPKIDVQRRDNGVRAGWLNSYMFVLLHVVMLFQLVLFWLAFFKDVFDNSQSSWPAPAVQHHISCVSEGNTTTMDAIQTVKQ